MATRIHTPWSCEELSLLLRAWADASAQVHKNMSSAVFGRFQTLCSEAGFSHNRAEQSATIKLKTMRNMHTVISVFLASCHPDASIDSTAATDSVSAASSSPEERPGDGDCGGVNKSSDPESLAPWFSMSDQKRRRCFAAITQTTYMFTNITQEHFALIQAVLTKGGAVALELPEVKWDPADENGKNGAAVAVAGPRKRKRRATKVGVGSMMPTLVMKEVSAVMEDIGEQFRVVLERFKARKPFDARLPNSEDEPAAATISVPQSPPERKGCVKEIAVVPAPCESRELAPEDDGSSTESEDEWDEIVPRSPVREEPGVVVVPAATLTVKREPQDVGEGRHGASTAENKSLKRSLSPTSSLHTEKCSRGVQPEVAMLMDALEKQTFAAREMLRKAKDARKRDQAERKQILKHLRKEQDARHAVLESLRHQEEVIRRQRFEWRHEQNELQQEWTRLNEVG